MFKMTVARMVQGESSIARVMGASVPIVEARRLMKIGAVINEEMKGYYELRNRLIKEYGDGDSISVESKGFPQFADELNKLLATEVEFNFDPLKIDALGNKAELSAADLLACSEFLIE